jgi:two-component system LytT family response regulator
MKAIIIDDEYYALQGLKMELEEIHGVEIVGIYEDGKGALEEINVKNPDIVFLDIEMPAINGLELFGKLIEKNQYLKIVFTTAYNHYAVQAFELNAVDYLVKPVQKQRLLKTIERLKSEFESENIEKRISIECFRHFSIIADKVEINNGWRTKKAEEVLGYLICEKGKFVSKEKISEALWPELDGEKSLSNLYLAYYYLKKQEKKLGVLFPIISERGKMCIDINEIDCDILSFDRYLKICNKID